jgi:hypothetical protein
MCTDLDNATAPAGARLAKMNPKAFILWMKECGYKDVDTNNPKQVVVKLYVGETLDLDSIKIEPNWHITAMTDRNKTVCNNFHFKVEVTKAAAHYWHYNLYYHAMNHTWHWVGDPNPNLAGTNEAGGGAASDLGKLRANRALVDMHARVHGMDNKVTKKNQEKMLTKLKQLTDRGTIAQGANNVWS